MRINIDDLTFESDYVSYNNFCYNETTSYYYLLAFSFINYPNTISLINKKIFKAKDIYVGSQKVRILPKDNYNIFKYKDDKTDLVHEIYIYNNKSPKHLRGDNQLVWYTKYGDTQETNIQNFFNALNSIVDVPLLDEWKEYLFNTVVVKNLGTRPRILQETMIYGGKAPLEVHYLRFNRQELIDYISEGLKNHNISINGYNTATNKIDSITGLDSYLNTYSETLANKIQESYVPCYTPGHDIYNKRLMDFDDSCYFGKMDLFYAQKCTIQATINALKTKKTAFIIGEQGSGKTIMSLGVCYGSRTHDGFNTVIMCPSHLVNKWKREIESYVPNGKAYIIKSIDDVIKLNPIIRNKKKTENLFMIMSKETAKLDNIMRPSVYYSPIKKGYVCPHCGHVIRASRYFSEYSYNSSPKLKDEDFYKESSKNDTCPVCHTNLWTMASENNEGWIKLGANGWVSNKRIYALREKLIDNEKRSKSDGNMLFAIEKYLKNNDEFPQPRMSRYPIAKYIRKHYKGYIDFVIGDELHLYNGASAQGEAFGQLASVAYKVLGLTGTLLNGYADSLFYMLFRAMPGTMIKEGFNFNSKESFNKTFGVIKNVYEDENPQSYLSNVKKITKKLPGVSPLVFTKFLLENAVFVNLSDMLDGLPNYSEYPTKITMTDELASNYEEIQTKIADEFSKDKTLIGSITKTLSAYPDYPFDFEPVVSSKTNEIIVTPVNVSDPNELLPKEQELLNIVEQKCNNGEKVLVYYSWTNIIDLDSRLKKILEDRGYRTSVLKASVSAQDREKWIREHADQTDVLLCNPSLVETGLDLLDYTTIVFYEIGYNLFTMRQASRRSWRLGQTRPISVYYLYYENTIQEQALSLMASKLQASMAIEGKFSEEGLQALSENEDLLTQIANSIVSGIRYKVNDNCFKQINTDVYHNTEKQEEIDIKNNETEDNEFDFLLDENNIDSFIDGESETIESSKINIDDNKIVQNIIKEPKKIFRRTKYEIEGKKYELNYWTQKYKDNLIAKLLNNKENIEDICDCAQ